MHDNRTPESMTDECVNSYSPVISSLAREIWKNPESGYRERHTSSLIKNIMADAGFKIRDGLAVTGFSASLDSGKPGPSCALLGELDSLILPSHPCADPSTGAVHACGHFIQAAALAGAALALKKAGAENFISGRIVFIFCPAEECVETEYRVSLIDSGKIGFLGGKQNMIAEGAFENCHTALMAHIGGGSFNAMESNGFIKKNILFKGRSCHAASPQNGVNALAAANLAMNALAFMRETFSNDPTIRMHGIITKGGDAANIIPDRVTMEYQIRTNTREKLLSLSERFDTAVTHSALALGAEAVIRTLPGYMPMKNDPKLLQVYSASARAVFGDPSIESHAYYDPGCTDMGDVSALMPAIHPFFPGAVGGVHSENFNVPDIDAASCNAAKLLAFSALALQKDGASRAEEVIASNAGRRFLTRNEYVETLRNFVGK